MAVTALPADQRDQHAGGGVAEKMRAHHDPGEHHEEDACAYAAGEQMALWVKAGQQHGEQEEQRAGQGAGVSAGERGASLRTGTVPDTELRRILHLAITDPSPQELQHAGDDQHGEQELKISDEERTDARLLGRGKPAAKEQAEEQRTRHRQQNCHAGRRPGKDA